MTRRTREIGIRMAVGAQPGKLLGLILRESVPLSVIGIIVGVPFAIAATRPIAHMLFGVTPGDPVTFVVAAAGYWPARRAAKIDPMAAMRCE